MDPGGSGGDTYSFFAGWRHDLRVEQIGPAQPKRRYPRCLAGARRVPPEERGDLTTATAGLRLTEAHRTWSRPRPPPRSENAG